MSGAHPVLGSAAVEVYVLPEVAAIVVREPLRLPLLSHGVRLLQQVCSAAGCGSNFRRLLIMLSMQQIAAVTCSNGTLAKYCCSCPACL